MRSGGGLPIGNYTSQWFANFYLTDLDNYIKHVLKVRYYIRYMDDMILFLPNKRKLRKVKESIEEYLGKEGLDLKDSWQLFKTDSRPLDFLGYRFHRDHITLRRSNFLRIRRRIKKVYKKGINYLNACAIISYNGFISHSDCYTFKKKYLYPYISIKACKGVISDENRKQCQTYSESFNFGW